MVYAGLKHRGNPAFPDARWVSFLNPAYGLSEVLGKVFRIGHLGDLNELMLASAIAAASEYWRQTAAPLAARG